MNINLNGVTVQKCQTEIGEYVIDFYPVDHKRQTVKQEIPDRYSVVHTEYADGDEMVIWYLKPTNKTV